MPARNRVILGCLFLLALCGLAIGQDSPGKGEKPGVEMPLLTYDQLAQFVHNQKGKVVYVDFWRSNCVPCKQSMPGLVDLQRKYGSAGFLVVTVSLDDPAKPDQRQAALAFLGKEKLNLKELTCFQLNEKPDFAVNRLQPDSTRNRPPPDSTSEKPQSVAVPLGFLFDRDGRVVKRSAGFAHDELDKLIGSLLEK